MGVQTHPLPSTSWQRTFQRIINPVVLWSSTWNLAMDRCFYVSQHTPVARVLITCQTLASPCRLCCFGNLGLTIASGFAGLSLISSIVAGLSLVADVVARLDCFDTHDDISELSKSCSLEWLGHEVCDHFCSRTPFHTQLSFRDAIGNKEIPNCNVPRMFAARGPSILL